jgi:DNA mismatch endonuclease (patch repair protein)
MADIFTREKRSEVMSKIKGTDTKPEILVRQFLFNRGFRYRLHQKNLPGSPDIVLKKYNTAIQINGCFWHSHKNCKLFKLPKSRLEYWIPKLETNVSKDKKNMRLLKRLGWNVIVVWECELTTAKREKTLLQLEASILEGFTLK